MRGRTLGAIAGALALTPLLAVSGDFTSLGALAQSEFRKLSEDVGAAVSYKGVTPATPLGLIGFDIGVVLTATSVDNSTLLARAGAGGHSELFIPKLHLYKGLVAGLDLGGFVGGIPDLSGTIYGVDLRYAFLDDGVATPAVALRGSATATNGLGSLDISTFALDLLVSKRFALATPYVGVGAVRVSSEAKGTGLADEKFNKTRGFVGLNVNLAVVNVAVEAEKMGNNNSLSAKLGWRF